MKKNEALVSLGLIVSFAIVFVLGTSFAPAPKHTIEVQKSTTTVYEEGAHYVYENIDVVSSDGKVLSHDQKLLSVY